jgi:hypothetical protein
MMAWDPGVRYVDNRGSDEASFITLSQIDEASKVSRLGRVWPDGIW